MNDVSCPWKSPLLNQIWESLKSDKTRSHLREFSLFCVLDLHDTYIDKNDFAKDVGNILHLSDPIPSSQNDNAIQEA